MKFEYHAFEVEPYLQKEMQPVFTMRGIKPTAKYYTLVDLKEMKYALTTSLSDGVRVPVFAVATGEDRNKDINVKQLTHGSLLFAMGMENATMFIDKLQLNKPISRVITILATNCHALTNNRFRAYFGITVEVE